MSSTATLSRITLVQRAHLVDAAERDRSTGAPVLHVVFDADDFSDMSDRIGTERADGILVQLADRLQARLCPSGVTTHLSHEQLGITCIGLACGDDVSHDVARALATPIELGTELVEVRAS
ncbi:MAG TPA: diguanylate cyclase [Acidimicrobiales bacterium]|nr:diguanylate cyclase [Acidimicrobiales bacterium]